MKDVFISDWHLLNSRGPRHTALFQANLSALKQYGIHNFQHCRAATQKSFSNLIGYITEKSTIWPRCKTNVSLMHFWTIQKWNLPQRPEFPHYSLSKARTLLRSVVICYGMVIRYHHSQLNTGREKINNRRKKKKVKISQQNKYFVGHVLETA